jgi:hypothetical protein
VSANGSSGDEPNFRAAYLLLEAESHFALGGRIGPDQQRLCKRIRPGNLQLGTLLPLVRVVAEDGRLKQDAAIVFRFDQEADLASQLLQQAR